MTQNARENKGEMMRWPTLPRIGVDVARPSLSEAAERIVGAFLWPAREFFASRKADLLRELL
jgi:hypothetical protein